jgi:hypothetical protein
MTDTTTLAASLTPAMREALDWLATRHDPGVPAPKYLKDATLSALHRRGLCSRPRRCGGVDCEIWPRGIALRDKLKGDE